jgi:hypothetical protein
MAGFLLRCKIASEMQSERWAICTQIALQEAYFFDIM